jgi:hypothetical protein
MKQIAGFVSTKLHRSFAYGLADSRQYLAKYALGFSVQSGAAFLCVLFKYEKPPA